MNSTTSMSLKNKLLLSLLIFGCIQHTLHGQALDPNKQFEVACIGFYNIENLFDTINTPGVKDEEFIPQGEKQWNSTKYYHKLKNNARVISEMGKEITPEGIAVLGLCEIENRSVLEDLVREESIRGKNYAIVHHDGPDLRGVDVALLYQPKYFKLSSSKSYPVLLANDTSYHTRDQLLVSGDLLGERIHFIVCHWPSRRGGETKSAPLRMNAARVSMHIIDSLRAADPSAKIILMGDLNDDPKNKSITKGLGAGGKLNKLKEGQLFNAADESYRKGIGTLAWRDSWNLFDQMIMTPALVDATATYPDFRFYKFKVFNKTYLTQAEGSFKGYPYRTYVGSEFKGGYSDHFPVYSVLIREKKAD